MFSCAVVLISKQLFLRSSSSSLITPTCQNDLFVSRAVWLLLHLSLANSVDHSGMQDYSDVVRLLSACRCIKVENELLIIVTFKLRFQNKSKK